jgi:hypothetical protein
MPEIVDGQGARGFVAELRLRQLMNHAFVMFLPRSPRKRHCNNTLDVIHTTLVYHSTSDG